MVQDAQVAYTIWKKKKERAIGYQFAFFAIGIDADGINFDGQFGRAEPHSV